MVVSIYTNQIRSNLGVLQLLLFSVTLTSRPRMVKGLITFFQSFVRNHGITEYKMSICHAITIDAKNKYNRWQVQINRYIITYTWTILGDRCNVEFALRHPNSNFELRNERSQKRKLKWVKVKRGKKYWKHREPVGEQSLGEDERMKLGGHAESWRASLDWVSGVPWGPSEET